MCVDAQRGTAAKKEYTQVFITSSNYSKNRRKYRKKKIFHLHFITFHTINFMFFYDGYNTPFVLHIESLVRKFCVQPMMEGRKREFIEFAVGVILVMWY